MMFSLNPIVFILLISLNNVFSVYLPSTEQNGRTSQQRGAKLFALQYLPFISVIVDHNPCVAEENGRNGTCYTKQDCLNKGGLSSSSCANGYGTCCMFERECGAVVSHNQSYLINDGYPSAFTGIGNCQYIIEKMNNNICQLRLDLEVMNLAGPSPTTSMCEEDTFTVVGTAGENPRVICGMNSGQHMYLDLASGTATARINIATTTPDQDRSWRIKVSQIECNSVERAPPHCLQYYTAYSGSIKSFNYQLENGVHIGGQSYTVCLKTREGFCGITYKSSSFSISLDDAAAVATTGDANCLGDFVSIFTMDKTNAVGEDRYCGSAFEDTTTYSKPFQIRVISDELEPVADVDNKGFELKYMQIPC